MKIAMAGDHAGFSLKEEIAKVLKGQGHEIEDFGAFDENAVDLPDHVYPAALAVGEGRAERGIFVDGVGYGSALIANRIYGVYAAVCQDRSARDWPGRIRTQTCSASAARSSVRRSLTRS